jgi:hypothetical protein
MVRTRHRVVVGAMLAWGGATVACVGGIGGGTPGGDASEADGRRVGPDGSTVGPDGATPPGTDVRIVPGVDVPVVPGTDVVTVADVPRVIDVPVVTGDAGPPAGNPAGHCAVPAEAGLEDVSRPDHVIGTGTPASCTSDAVVNTIALGGVITFNCGPAPVTITLTRTARIFNNTGPRIVIDGGNRVTLSGGGVRRILYQNTCDSSLVFTTSHCQDQDHPRLTVQNLTFADGNSTGETTEGGGGGAVFARGGRLKIVNSWFFRNRCDETGPDLGGAAVRVLSQSGGLPVYVTQSTFGGAAGLGGRCSNGGALSSIGVSWTVLNSLFTHNTAVGRGANPARAGTPGGGSGGAIYNDGNTFTLSLCGTQITDNSAVEGGGAVFFVSNDRTGRLLVTDSELRRNPNMGFETTGYPGIFYLGSGSPVVSGSVIAR